MFKRNKEVYLNVLAGGAPLALYRLMVYSDLDYSQTFNETSYKRKTLHRRNHTIEGAIVRYANPASFSFTLPIMNSYATSYPAILSLATTLTNYNLEAFDLYIVTDDGVDRLQTCYLESLVMNISPGNIITATVSGTAARLIENAGTLPLTVTPEIFNPAILRGGQIILDGDVVDRISGLNIEIVHTVNWNDPKSQHSTDGYPTYATLGDSRLSGSFSTYNTEDSFTEKSENSSVNIQIVSEIGQTPPLLELDLSSITHTSRLDSSSDVEQRVFDFRLTSNTLENPIYKGV